MNKRKIVLLAMVILVLLFANSVYALDIDIVGKYNIYKDTGLETAPIIEMRIGNPFYIWGSYEDTMVRLVGQEVADTKIYGGGIGIKKKIDSISLYIQGGWYQPNFNEKVSSGEGVMLTLMNQLPSNVYPIDTVHYPVFLFCPGDLHIL